jgi:SlyX protein
LAEDERIIDLEVRIAHQDRTIAALDEVVREFADRVERLEALVSGLREALDEGKGRGPAHDPPPHY